MYSKSLPMMFMSHYDMEVKGVGIVMSSSYKNMAGVGVEMSSQKATSILRKSTKTVFFSNLWKFI